MPYPLDPTTCRPRYPAQSRLIPSLTDSLKTNGQITPALVRPVTPTADQPQPYEIVCGHRRHAAILHLNQNGYEFPFFADIIDLTDAEAFRLADIDNRERADISPYQRAQTYGHALTAIYNDSQAEMAAALDITTSTLSRYLLLAALPDPILNAYYNRDAIRLIDATTLRPLLKDPKTGGLVLAKAKKLASQQGIRRFNSQKPLTPATILRRLTNAADPPLRARHEIRSPAGLIIADACRTKSGKITIGLTRHPSIALHEKIAAARELVLKLSGSENSPTPQNVH